MDRFVLTDAQWAKIELHCLGKPTAPGRSGRNNRLLIEGVLWIALTGSPWRDLPSYGRQLEHGVPAVSRLARSRSFQEDFRCLVKGAGHGMRHG
jgi:transposase